MSDDPIFAEQLCADLRAEAALSGGQRGVIHLPLHASLLPQARALVLRDGRGSISFIQRHLRIGYNAAARLIEQLELEGLLRPLPTGGYALVVASDSEGGTPE